MANVLPPKITVAGLINQGPVIPLPDGYTGHVRDPKSGSTTANGTWCLARKIKRNGESTAVFLCVDLYTGLFVEKLLVMV